MQTQEYEAMYRSEEKLWWYVGLRDLLGRVLARYGFRGARVLDSGCGTGMNAVFLQKSGYEVASAVDPSLRALEFSRRRGIGPLLRASTASLPFPDAAFDITCSLDVLGILEEPQRRQAVRELYRVTRPGGIVIVHAAALEFLRSRHDEAINWQRRFTRMELKQLLLAEGHSRGVEVLRLTYHVSALFPAVALVKMIRRCVGAARSGSTSDQQLTPGVFNRPLLALSVAENRLLELMNMPIGSSLLAVVRVQQARSTSVR